MQRAALILRQALQAEKSETDLKGLSRSKHVSPLHLDLAMTLHNTVALVEDEGRLAEAASMAEEAYGLRKVAFGSAPHEDLAASLGCLGRVRMQQRRFTEADSTLRRAIAIFTQVNRDSSMQATQSDASIVLNDLGVLLHKQGHYDESIAAHETALQVREKLSVGSVVESLLNMAVVLEDAGAFQKALSLADQIISQHAVSLGRTHRTVSMASHLAGRCSHQLGHSQKAAWYHERQSAACIATLGQSMGNLNCPESLVALAGQRWPGMQEAAKAAQLLRWSLSMYGSCDAKGNPLAAATTCGLLAQVLHATAQSSEDLQEASSLLQSAITTRQKHRANVVDMKIGKEEIFEQGLLAAVLFAQGQVPAALELLEQIRAIQQLSLPESASELALTEERIRTVKEFQQSL
eukprot:gnl/MRDRNA2_/MRDRNA2_67244_c0_seq1.p1 gnl/MRDRNA2_/MRDRNA2_67244_c0~~gnl/MRDRNA2_/MRDRNA2_67244_c0_seq1.p1  ORF type:complete len:461 (-),score=102.02 gnl/MRDRNA2_/MRDRNA2_67244_c0_seq1:113-1333(-)